MRAGNRLSVLTSLLIMSLVIGCSDSRTSEEYATLAKESLAQGNTNAAIINLKNLLKQDAKHGEGRFLLGKSYAQKGSWLAAEKELERALDYGYESEEVIPYLAKVYYYLSDIKALEEFLEQSYGQSAETQNIIKTFLAITYIKEENYQLGNIALFDVIESNFESKYTQLSIAWNFGKERKLKQALEVVSQLIDEQPDFAEAFEYQGFLFYAQQDMANSALSFGSFLALHPQSIETRVMYGLALAGAGNFEEGEKQADILLKIAPNNPYINQIKAQARFSAKDFIQAKQFAEVAIRGSQKLVISRVIAGISAYQLKQPEAAYAYLNAVKNQLTYKHPAKKLLTALRLQLGYEQDAYDELSKAPVEQLDASLLSSSAMELFKLGKSNEADFLLAKAAKKSPDNADIIYQQGILKFLENDESATEYFQNALDKNPELDAALVMLVMTELTNKNYAAAHQLADSIAQDNPELSQTFKGLIYTKQGDLIKAKQAYTAVLAINLDNASVLYKLGEIAEQENAIEQAINYYQKALTADENIAPAVSALLKYSKDKTYSGDLTDFFELNVKRNNQSSASSLALAALYIMMEDLTSAEIAINEGLSVDQKNIKLLMFKGKVQANSRDYDGALLTFSQVIEQNTSVRAAHLAKVKILTLKGDIPAAIEHQKEVIDIFPNSISLGLDIVELYIKNDELFPAKKVMANIKSSSTLKHIRIDRVEGKVAFLDKQYAKAEKLLSGVFQQAKSEDVLLELVQSLQHLNRDKEALALIDATYGEKITSLPFDVLMKKAELFEKSSPVEAIKIYQHVLKNTNNHYAILNNLALTFLKIGNLKQAMINAQAALNKAPTVAAVKNTYGLVLLASDSNVEALKYLEQSLNEDKMNANYQVHYAQALVANDKLQQAKEAISAINKNELSKDSIIRLEKLNATL